MVRQLAKQSCAQRRIKQSTQAIWITDWRRNPITKARNEVMYLETGCARGASKAILHSGKHAMDVISHTLRASKCSILKDSTSHSHRCLFRHSSANSSNLWRSTCLHKCNSFHKNSISTTSSLSQVHSRCSSKVFHKCSLLCPCKCSKFSFEKAFTCKDIIKWY